jgi:hypothetical protein
MPHLCSVEVHATQRSAAARRGLVRPSPRDRRPPIGADPWLHFRSAFVPPSNAPAATMKNSKNNDMTAFVPTVANQSTTMKHHKIDNMPTSAPTIADPPNSSLNFTNNGKSVIEITLSVQPGTTMTIKSGVMPALIVKSAVVQSVAAQSNIEKNSKDDDSSTVVQTIIIPTNTKRYAKTVDISACEQTLVVKSLTTENSQLNNKPAFEQTAADPNIDDNSATVLTIPDKPNTMIDSKIDDKAASVQPFVDIASTIKYSKIDDMPSNVQTFADQTTTKDNFKIDDTMINPENDDKSASVLTSADQPFTIKNSKIDVIADLPIVNDKFFDTVVPGTAATSEGVCRCLLFARLPLAPDDEIRIAEAIDYLFEFILDPQWSLRPFSSSCPSAIGSHFASCCDAGEDMLNLASKFLRPHCTVGCSGSQIRAHDAQTTVSMARGRRSLQHLCNTAEAAALSNIPCLPKGQPKASRARLKAISKR